MYPHTRTSPAEVKRYLNKLIETEDLKKEFISWLRFFDEDPKKIPLERYAQHVKAALMRKISDRESHNLVFALCDEINLMVFGPPTHHLCNHEKSSFTARYFI